MIGTLQASGNGEAKTYPAPTPLSELQETALEHNAQLIGRIREDEHSQDLWEATQKDAGMGRMTSPVPVGGIDLAQVRLAPRFGVAQQRSDGSTKV